MPRPVCAGRDAARYEISSFSIASAMRMFTCYGVKRTSMGDPAQEAGVSRQPLYNAYKKTDDVLRAASTSSAIRPTRKTMASTAPDRKSWTPRPSASGR